MGREITKIIKERERKTKISLKRENEILRDMGKYLFQLTNATSGMFFYYTKKISQLESKIKKLNNGKRK